tara:strand:- start:757 stop:1461 length:705 start_codon:yes stop_codon:yes gene_type:complete
MEQLVRLQDIDTKLRDLNDLLGDLPSKVDELDIREQSIKNEIDGDKDKLKNLEVDINKKELDLNSNSIKIDKLKDQLFLVTNNKQYDALMTEIDHLKEQKSKCETESIELLEEKEKTIENIKNMESDLVSLSGDLADRKNKLKSAISDSADQKSNLENMRKKELEGIDSSILSIYDNVIQARDGIAVVPLAGSGCGGCGAHVPPQKVTEIRANTGMHRCDMCGRFLYEEKIKVN